MTLQDVLNSITADAATVTADSAKLALDQATEGHDSQTFLAAIAAAGIPKFSVLSADGSSVATYTIVPNSVPPYTVETTPIAGFITIPEPAAAA